jgi:hypothetical protein
VNLAAVHSAVRAALEPLGIEVGSEVLAIWRDRQLHGKAAISAEAMRRLADLAAQLARELS